MKNLPIYTQYMYSYPHKNAYRPVEAEQIKTYLQKLIGGQKTIYYHIPFCETKCGYCNLFSVATEAGDLKINQYISAVKRQAQQYADLMNCEKIAFETLIFGGGTPLLLSIKQCEQLFRLAEKSLGMVLQTAYIGMETSPNQTSKEKLSYLKLRGVNRMSIGIQSFVQEELNTLKRRHTSTASRKAAELIKETGFDEMNIDLIYGIPGQTIESLDYSLSCALEYQPQELFVYPLYVRKDTALYGKEKPDTALQYEMYHYLAGRLAAEGYIQTSMRRFVKKGLKESKSCGFEETLALGCGGRSYIGNLHFCEPYSIQNDKCKNTLNTYSQKIDFLQGLSGYLLDEEEHKRRFIIRNLLYYQGVALNEYQYIFKVSAEKEFPLLEELIKNKWVVRKENYLILTTEGLAYSDYIGGLFISTKVKEKMEQVRC